MRVQRVQAPDAELLSVASRAWQGLDAERLSLSATPITAQPSAYVMAKWETVPYGVTGAINVQAAHNGSSIFFRLEWPDETRDDRVSNTDQFTDAVAVMFPVGDDAPLQSMGSPQAPVNAWYWRPDLAAPYNVLAKGTGTTRRTSDGGLVAQGGYSAGKWSVVLGRGFQAGAPYAPLAPGALRKVAFAVWQGSNQERGGLKAVTLEWQRLEIEA